MARAGTFVVADFPAGFRSTTAAPQSHADNIKLAKGVAGCGPYVVNRVDVDPSYSLQQASGGLMRTDVVGNAFDTPPTPSRPAALPSIAVLPPLLMV